MDRRMESTQSTSSLEESFPFAMLPPKTNEDKTVLHVLPPNKASLADFNSLSLSEAVLNLLSFTVGSGLLALPYAVSKGGLVAVVALLVVPVICVYTGKILIDCLYEDRLNGNRVRVRSTYRDIGDAYWPGKGGIITVIIQVVQLVIAAAACIALSASLLSHILDFVDLSDRKWIFIAALLIFPLVLVRNLSQVAWLNILSIAALFSPIVVITGYGFLSSKPWDIHDFHLWNIEGVPLTISIVVHSYVPHGALLVIENSMRDKSNYNQMLTTTFVLCAILRNVFAVNGFFSYYDRMHVVISNSLPPGVIIVANGLLFVYSILCYSFIVVSLLHIIETSIVAKFNRFWFTVSRVVLIVVPLVTALLIPHYAMLIALSGNFKAILGFILPCLFHLKLKVNVLNIWNIFVHFVILAFGIAIMIIGTTATVYQIVRESL